NDVIVTLGIVPSYPETGYGYIKTGAEIPDIAVDIEMYRVEAFVEKPDRVTAEKYLKYGKFLWNSGMFVFSARRILLELERYQSAIYSGAISISKDDGTISDIESVFSQLPDLSIDCAVMEKTDRIVMFKVTFPWADVGSWAALYNHVADKGNGNRATGDHIYLNCNDTLIWSKYRLVAAIDLQDIVIVDTEDALLVCSRNSTQKVGNIIKILRSHKQWEKFI
ncbi:mannose-1-phosphate guanylyltransferase, partial [bacterium]|nr:mannose-1-phosphate guanylyltransferase [candidate division CSSED10-310 bacterium]